MGNPPAQPTQQAVAAALASSQYVTCVTKECNGKMFLQASAYKRLSKIALATDQDMLVPIELSVCGKCGAVQTELLPENMKEDFS